MEIVVAKAGDISDWTDLAKDVGDTMRNPNMDTDPLFLEYARRKLEQGDALMALDNGQCAGFIGFSRHNNSITWLAVSSEYRRRGVASKLLSAALMLLDATKKITVNTYPASYMPGKPAREFYFKHGFVETTGEVFYYHEYEMVELAIIPI